MAYITLRDVQLAFGGPALLDGANFHWSAVNECV